MWDARHGASSVVTLVVVKAGTSSEARVAGMCRMLACMCGELRVGSMAAHMNVRAHDTCLYNRIDVGEAMIQIEGS